MAEVGATFKPGQKVPHSGIYDVIHDPVHAQRHQVIIAEIMSVSAWL